MNLDMRRYYIDNLKWIILLILIPYHTAMAWNVWGEPNYVYFEGNRLISSVVAFFSPYFMPLLFVLAGMGAKYSLQKRTSREYLIERVKRLFIPFLFGTIVLMPIMSYIGDKFNYSYEGGFLQHYAVFFSRFTDLTGADGGFSVGQFWFLLYLLIISVVGTAMITFFKKLLSKLKRSIPLWMFFSLGLPLPLLSELISVGGKSLAEYMYLFMIGYFLSVDDNIINKAEKKGWLLFGVGMAATILNVYLFIWADVKCGLLNDISKYISEWVMIIALIGLAKRYLNFNGKVTNYMKSRSFLFYIYHYVWIVLFQYILYAIYGNDTFILYIGSLLLSYLMTFVCCEVSIRIPFLCFITGVKRSENSIKRSG